MQTDGQTLRHTNLCAGEYMPISTGITLSGHSEVSPAATMPRQLQLWESYTHPCQEQVQGEERYGATHSWPRHYADTSDQLHTLGALPQGQNSRNHWIAGCFVDLQAWTFYSWHKSLTTAHNHYTDRAISAANVEVTLPPYHKAAPLKISLHLAKFLNTAIQGADANLRIWQPINMKAYTLKPSAVENGKR
jgi:hypothetical protein